MRRFKALYINEMIKISHKFVVIIILGIMILGVAGFGGLMKLQQTSAISGMGQATDKEWVKQEMQNQLDYYKSELASINQKIDAAATEEEKVMLQQDRVYMEQQVELYQFAVEKEINLNSGGFKATLLNDMTDLKSKLKSLELIPVSEQTSDQKAQIPSLKKSIEEYSAILDTGDFAAYIEIRNRMIAEDPALDSSEKKLKTETNLLWLSLDPDGTAGEDGDGYLLQSTLNQVEVYKRSLLYNMDYSTSGQYMKPLTPDGRQDIENNLAILMYKAENGLLDASYDTSKQIQESAITGMFGFGLFLLVCMMLILAGGAISQEISTGSIKSLIISPAKRYKIFFAKLASLVTVGILAALFLYGLTVQMNGLYFGYGSGAPFVFAVDGKVFEMGFLVYRFLYLLVNFIDVLVYMMLAFMLSVITRNTAASVGISIAVYFGGNLANTFISLFATGEWAKFIPFNNMSLASRIFPDPMAGFGMNIFGYQSVVPSITFSAVYLAVLVICMGYIALDSFNRRDIK